jgi:hypothetical protein
VESENGEERGGPGRGTGQHSGAASVGSGPTAARAGGTAWHVTWPTEQGRGGGANRWAAAIVPGGSTG